MASTPIGPFLDDPWVRRVYTGPSRRVDESEADRILGIELHMQSLGIWDSYTIYLDQIIDTEQLRHLSPYEQRQEAARLTIAAMHAARQKP